MSRYVPEITAETVAQNARSGRSANIANFV